MYPADKGLQLLDGIRCFQNRPADGEGDLGLKHDFHEGTSLDGGAAGCGVGQEIGSPCRLIDPELFLGGTAGIGHLVSHRRTKPLFQGCVEAGLETVGLVDIKRAVGQGKEGYLSLGIDGHEEVTDHLFSFGKTAPGSLFRHDGHIAGGMEGYEKGHHGPGNGISHHP